MGFQQALSGLNAAAKNLDVIGNNVANTTTVGFKGAQAQFADVYASSLSGAGGTQIGIGTQIATVAQQFTQGNITVTNNALDLAINGKGFFRMSQGGAVTYARNGQFQLDKDGYVVNSKGLRLTGYQAVNGVILPGNLGDLQISAADLLPKPTANATVGANLSSADPVKPIGAFNPLLPATFNFSTATTIYDSLGQSHNATFYFNKTAANTWGVSTYVDGAVTAGGVSVLTFNTNGSFLSVTNAAQSATLANGAATPLTVTMDYAQMTQFGSAFGVNTLSQDGYASGRLNGFNIGADGVILGRYSNGQSQSLGQVALANFVNPQGLQPLGNNQFADTPTSGAPLVGTPNSASLGVLQSAAVEDSNVDLTAELVNMITAQRVYQANAQTIKAQDQVLQTLVNL